MQVNCSNIMHYKQFLLQNLSLFQVFFSSIMLFCGGTCNNIPKVLLSNARFSHYEPNDERVCGL